MKWQYILSMISAVTTAYIEIFAYGHFKTDLCHVPVCPHPFRIQTEISRKMSSVNDVGEGVGKSYRAYQHISQILSAGKFQFQ